MAAAAALFHAGKVEYLLVSGDNHRVGYDEPSDMKEALQALGEGALAAECARLEAAAARKPQAAEG